MSPDEIAAMLDDLAHAISERAVEQEQHVGASDGRTFYPLTGSQAITVIIMALRKMAERVSQS